MARKSMIGAVAVAALGALFLAGGGLSTASAQQRFETSAGSVEVEAVATGLSGPWAFDLLPDGGALVTEKAGRLLHLRADGALHPVAGLPRVATGGHRGLLDVTLARDFAESRRLWVTLAFKIRRGAALAVLGARLGRDGSRLEDVAPVVVQNPATDTPWGYGSRVVEGPDGTVFLVGGERGVHGAAQRPDSLFGKVLRVGTDGKPPRDNPYSQGGGQPEVYSLGHRNPQGAAIGPDGALWIVDHGAQGGDELNRIEAGANYGWPDVSYGLDDAGQPFPKGSSVPGIEPPRAYWDSAIAPSGLAFMRGAMFPEWKGDALIGSLNSGVVVRVPAAALGPGPDRVDDRQERLFDGAYPRTRDVKVAPDGAIWFLSEVNGALYRAHRVD